MNHKKILIITVGGSDEPVVNAINYAGDETPADWQNPVPIKFLTVENTKFEFYLGIKSKNSEGLLDKTKRLLLEALKEYGIEAKTSLGYGILKETNT